MENTDWETYQALQCSMYSEVLLDLTPTAYFSISVNVLFCITAILGNALILVALQKDSLLHPASKMLFRCLAVADFCVGLITQPCFVTYLISVVKKNGFDNCKHVTGFLHISTSLLCGISLATVTTISVDRLLALLLGLRYRQVVTLARVRRISFLTWLTFSALNMLYFWNARIFLTAVSCNVLSFLIVSTFCYLKIYFSLRHRQRSTPGPPSVPSQVQVLKYKRTVSSALWISISMIACYLPFTVVAAVGVTHQDPSFSVIGEGITVTLIYFNSSLNPVLYCWRIREVRRAVKATIGLFCFFCPVEGSSSCAMVLGADRPPDRKSA